MIQLKLGRSKILLNCWFFEFMI
ncbi:uncharacterized protein METZ01_LOCUS328357, partial [marine metagenome]